MDRNRALEQVKASTFTGKNSAFLGCLLCGFTFKWTTEIETAAVSSNREFKWNPSWFDSLTPEERQFILLHELWHIALLHGIRGQGKDHEKWNHACDIYINNYLIREGYTFVKGGVKDLSWEGDYTEEDIYKTLPDKPKPQSWGSSEFIQADENVALVTSALTTAKMAGNAPGNIEKLLSSYLRPKLPWRQILNNYLLEKINSDWSWSRPNRRYREYYLPGYIPQDGRLISIAMYLDTSGSIDEEDIERFVSEIKFVQEKLQPSKLIVVQFDTEIQEETVYNENNPFRDFKAKGFGGTRYDCVYKHIIKHKPTLSIIFTDLYAIPMKKPKNCDVIWVIKNNEENAPYGKSIHV